VNTTENLIEEIRELPMFSDLDDNYLALLADCGHLETFHAGDYLFNEGQTASDLYVLLSGGVTLGQFAGDLGDFEVERLTPGAVISWAWLIPPHRNWFSARANAKSEVLIFNGLCIRGKCLEDPRFGYLILQRMIAVAGDRLSHVRKRLNAECEGVS
jgi:CRP-like cAMP-binding protein